MCRLEFERLTIENVILKRNPKSQTHDHAGLVVSDLRKSFQTPARTPIEVLRGVSFSAAAGEMLAIMGASGAGKSTLLQLLGGLEAVDAGSIRLGDFDVARARSADLARFRNKMVGFVFQFHHLLPDLSAAENVALPLLINRASWRESMQRAAAALKRTGLGERMTHPVGHLSGGERQRVAVARALITEPRLVLADEPTGNLDGPTGDEISAMLASFCRAHKAAVLIATHQDHLARACDRILVLQDGCLSSRENLPLMK